MVADASPRKVGPYRLVRRLGAGGMGVVWLGHDAALDRPVAVKMINAERVASSERRDEIEARLAREAKAAARIDDPHVCRILHLERGADGETCIVMEHVEGRSLKDVLKDDGVLPVARAVGIARQIAQGMAAAHDLGVVHRDLKPGNIMLADRPDGADFVKILDFGLAKLDDDDAALTRAGDVIGTARYMAPEQIRGGAVDARTDVYALGVLIFRMIAGRAPFEAASPGEIVGMHVSRPAPRLAVTARIPVPATLDAVVDRCLQKLPAQRFATMRDVVAALDAAADYWVDDTASQGRDVAPLASIDDVPREISGNSRKVVPIPMPADDAEVPDAQRTVLASTATEQRGYDGLEGVVSAGSAAQRDDGDVWATDGARRIPAPASASAATTSTLSPYDPTRTVVAPTTVPSRPAYAPPPAPGAPVGAGNAAGVPVAEVKATAVIAFATVLASAIVVLALWIALR